MSELSHFNVQDTANKPQCKADRNAIIIIITYNSRNVMSYSISTLLIRSLRDVFGENDPARRRAAIDEIYNEDCAFYDPMKGVFRAETRSIASQARSGPLILTFNISPLPRRRSWVIADGLNGYRAALVRRQLTPGLISSLLGTAGFPPFIFFSTNYPELNSAVRCPNEGRRGRIFLFQ